MDDEAFLREVLGGIREPCEEDPGLRGCCGSRQLGPHREDCRLSPSTQDAMLDHEQMYWHETEVQA